MLWGAASVLCLSGRASCPHPPCDLALLWDCGFLVSWVSPGVCRHLSLLPRPLRLLYMGIVGVVAYTTVEKLGGWMSCG